jgi:hypothetical protein
MINDSWLTELCTPEPNTGCWLWTGDAARYGRIQIGGIIKAAHRAVYEMAVGPIADGMVIDHLCGEPLCVNPGHLEQVTKAENSRRGRPIAQRTAGRGVMDALGIGCLRPRAVLLPFTVEEREELRRAAVNTGRPLAQWIRWVALEAARGSAFR